MQGRRHGNPQDKFIHARGTAMGKKKSPGGLELEDEIRRLKKMYAEERLKAEIHQEAMMATQASVQIAALGLCP